MISCDNAGLQPPSWSGTSVAGLGVQPLSFWLKMRTQAASGGVLECPSSGGAEPLAVGAGLGAGWEKVQVLQCPMNLSQGQSTLQAVFEEQWWVGKGESQRLSWAPLSSRQHLSQQ